MQSLESLKRKRELEVKFRSLKRIRYMAVWEEFVPRLLCLKMEEWAVSQGLQVASTNSKRQRNRFFARSSEKKLSLLYLDPYSEIHVRFILYRTIRK